MKHARIILLVAVVFVLALTLIACQGNHEHTWVDADCDSPKTCSECGVTEGEALGHAAEGIEAKAPTCTKTGLTEGTKCSVCNEILVAQEEVPATGHNYTITVIPPTCTVAGYSLYFCSCGSIYTADEVLAPGHDLVVDEAVDATCTETGLTQGGACKNCDYVVEQKVVPATGHKDEDGDYKCDTCTADLCTDHIPAEAVKENEVAPSCSAKGSYDSVVKCSACGEEISRETISVPEIAHTAGEAVKENEVAPSCTKAGSYDNVVKCSVCGAEMSRETVAVSALGHSYENCQCSVCGEALPTLGHADAFDFTSQSGYDAALAGGKLGFVGSFRDNSGSFQFNTNSAIQLVAPANSTVTIAGHSAQYGVFNIYLNGEKAEITAENGVYKFTVTAATKVVIATGDEGASYSYIKSIVLEEYIDRTIAADTTITFGSEGNYKNSIVDFSGIQIGDNGGNNSQVKNGSFDLILKAGAKVVIHGYPGYTSYKIGDGEEIKDEYYTYLALADETITITPVNGNNYFYSIEITLHQGIELVSATESSCSVAGHKAYYTCSCHGELTEKVALDLLPHTEETVPGYAATCIANGLTDGKKCTVCGATTVAQQPINALGHKDEDANFKCDVCQTDLCTNHVAAEAAEENRVEATCTVAGSYDLVVKCSICGHELSRETKPLAIIPHREETVSGKNATCEAAGLTEGKKCSVCGTITVEQKEIPALGHTEVAVAGKSATCEAAGLTEGKKCSVCGTVTVAQKEIPALGHAYATQYVWAEDNSTCTEKQVCANDASHVITGETVTVSKVVLNVTASKVTYTYYAGEQTKTVESEVKLENNIATINAPAIAGRVASHDYVKFSFNDAAATYAFDIYYSEIDVWDGVSVSESLQGSGTAEDPYLIQSAADLAYIAKVVNALAVKTSAFSGNYIVMTKSIDLNGYELHIGTGTGWNDRQMFAAYLDGNNCTIRGINNSRSLFGCIEGGWVKNLSLYGEVNVVKGANSIGVLVGYNRLAPLSNITNYATMNGNGNVGGIVGNMEQSNDNPSTNLVNYGAISGSNNVGGIAGLIGRQLLNCTNWGIISGDHDIGGIVGNLYWACTLTNCINYGYVNGGYNIGGIAGVRNGSIVATLNDCANYGSVSGTSCTSTGIDGITSAESTQNGCVNNGSVAIVEHQLTLTDAKAATCEEDGNVAYGHCSVCDKNYDAEGKALASVVISAIGHAWDGGVTADNKITYTCGNCGTTRVEEAKSIITVNYLNIDGTVAAEADTLEASYNEIFTVYAKSIEGYAPSHDYVKLLVQSNTTVTIYYSEVSVWDGTSVSTGLSGTGTAEDPFLIQSAADFAYFAGVINAVEGAAGVNYKVTTFKGQYFKMTKSVDLNGHYLVVGMHAGWNNYQGFFGHFNGNNCSIRGIDLDGSAGSSSTALFGCVNTGSIKNLSIYGNVKGNSGAAGLVGYTVTNAIIENVTSYVNVTSKVANGRQGTVGGIVANQENSAGVLLNCVNYGTVICDSYIVGGIVGSGGKDMTGCVNWGNVTGANVSVGGISGSTKDKGTISGCVNYGTVTGATTAYGQIGGIVGTAKKPVTDCANYGTVIGKTSKGVGQIYGTTTSTVTDCVENGEVKEYVAE